MLEVQPYHIGRARIVYSFDRKLYDRATRARRCQPLGLGGCFGGAAHAALVSGFNGQIASLFPGAAQVLQSDLGLTYGSQPKATGTTPPVTTLSGSLSATPVPIWFKCTTAGAIGSGALFSAYVDGVGTTPFATGISPLAGSPVALSGPCSGLSIAWAAGSAALDNIWKATGSGLADQTVNGKNAAQATAAKQPIVTIGINGRVGLLFDGVDDTLDAASLTLPAPGTTPTFHWAVWRKVSEPGGSSVHFGDMGLIAHALFCPSGGTSFQTWNGIYGPLSSLTMGQWMRTEAIFTNSTSDYLKSGSLSAVTGVNALNSASPGGYQIGNSNNSVGRYSNMELLAHVITPYLPSPTQLSAASAKINLSTGYGPGAIAV